MIRPSAVLAAAIALAPFASDSDAKSALCFTTDDGEYGCDFVSTDADGSFEISASGKPKFSLVISEPGVGFVFGDYGDGGGNVALPGTYRRSQDDPACWVNDDTEAKLCAW